MPSCPLLAPCMSLHVQGRSYMRDCSHVLDYIHILHTALTTREAQRPAVLQGQVSLHTKVSGLHRGGSPLSMLPSSLLQGVVALSYGACLLVGNRHMLSTCTQRGPALPIRRQSTAGGRLLAPAATLQWAGESQPTRLTDRQQHKKHTEVTSTITHQNGIHSPAGP